MASVTTTLAVQGMTCGACTAAIENALKSSPGVASVNVSLLSERAVITHDPSNLTAEQAAGKIGDCGFDASVIESIQSAKNAPPALSNTPSGTSIATTIVSIQGMTCGACTSAVESAFKDVQGVEKFDISLLAERAVIRHDQHKLNLQQLVQMIEEKGFDAQVVTSESASTITTASSRNVSLKIYGVLDSKSANAVESAVRLLPGIESAIINLSSSRANVQYETSKIGVRVIVECVEQLGFNALLADNEDQNAQMESLAKTREINQWRRAFWSSFAFALPVFLISMIIPMGLPKLDFGAIQLIIPGLFLGDVICLMLTIPVQFGIGKHFYISSFNSISHGSPTMDVLVTFGTSAAFFYSIAAMGVSICMSPHNRPKTVFETSTMLITFITLGRYLENRAKGQTSRALSRLMSLAPSMATIYADPIAAKKVAEATSNSEKASDIALAERNIPSELIEVGDIVILRPGGQVPADGIIIHGQSFFDESMVTGEAEQIFKKEGSELLAGTVNENGRIEFEVTRAGRDTQLSQIVKLVQEAQTSRAPIQRMADIVAGYFVPIIMFLGLATFLIWMILSHALPENDTPMIFRQKESGGKLMVCLKLCISVIVFACPCALGLSTPTAVMVGTGVGAEHGILVKGGAALETATKIKHVVFDKTGTLTMGKMKVTAVKLEQIWKEKNWRQHLWWTIIGVAETGSEHPVGRAIVRTAKEMLKIHPDDALPGTIANFRASIGQGISANVEPSSTGTSKPYSVRIGKAEFLESEGVILPRNLKEGGEPAADETQPITLARTQILVAIDGVFAGYLSVADSVKPSAAATVLALDRMGIIASLVTGDQHSPALHVAKQVGIPLTNVHANVSPDQKRNIVKDIQAGATVVAMVGDGINDSPALATSDVGIALGTGTDVAMEAADIVLMRADDLLTVPAALHLSKTIFNRIKLNLLWACLYNIIGLPFAMGVGLILPGHFMLPPMAAGAAMALSSVSVVGSSLLLKFWSQPAWMTQENLEALGKQQDGLHIMSLDKGRGVSSDLGLDAVTQWVQRVIGSRKAQKGAYAPLQDVEIV